jgi:hypothetical protein
MDSRMDMLGLVSGDTLPEVFAQHDDDMLPGSAILHTTTIFTPGCAASSKKTRGINVFEGLSRLPERREFFSGDEDSDSPFPSTSHGKKNSPTAETETETPPRQRLHQRSYSSNPGLMDLKYSSSTEGFSAEQRRSTVGDVLANTSTAKHRASRPRHRTGEPSTATLSPFPNEGDLSAEGAGGLPRHNRKDLSRQHSQFGPHVKVDVMEFACKGSLFVVVTEKGASKFRRVYLSTSVIPLTMSIVVDNLTASFSSSSSLGIHDDAEREDGHWLVLPLDRLRSVDAGMQHHLFERGGSPRRLAQASFSISYTSSSSSESLSHKGFVAKDLVDFEIWIEILRGLMALRTEGQQTALLKQLHVVVPVRPPSQTTALLDIIAAHSGSLQQLGYRDRAHVLDNSGGRDSKTSKLPLTQFQVSSNDSLSAPAHEHLASTDKEMIVTLLSSGQEVNVAQPAIKTSLQLIRESKEGTVRPSWLLKIGHVNVNYRVFYITSDMYFLCWRSKKKARGETRIEFSRIDSLIFGQTSKRFAQRHIPRALAPLCFTILYDGQSKQLHLCAPSQRSFEIWTEAICQCIGRARSRTVNLLHKHALDLYLYVPPVPELDSLQALVKKKYPLP